MRCRAVLFGVGVLLLPLSLACDGGRPAYNVYSAAFPSDVAACDAFNDFDRYRYTFAYSLESPHPSGPVDPQQIGTPPFGLAPDSPDLEQSQVYEGAIVNPDKIDLTVKTPNLPDLGIRFFEGHQWTNLAGEWVLAEHPDPYTYPPALVCHAIMRGLALTGTPTQETVNGMDTSHFKIEDVSLLTASYLFNGDSDMGRLLNRYSVDVWLTADGWPARLESGSEGTYPSGRQLLMGITLEIRDVNSGDISVEPPP